MSEAERAIIASHGPWPPTATADDSNLGSGVELAAALGQALFFEPGLSGDGAMSCASCHHPARWFTDGLPRAQGRKRLARNTPTIVDTRFSRWFGWTGASDSLWSVTLRAMTSVHEMRGTAASIAHHLRSDPRFDCVVAEAFGADPATLSDEAAMVLAAKAMAAFIETRISGPGEFDRFRAALLANNDAGMREYPESALRGLRLFIGEGRCSLCHLGPRFTNDEFADVAVPYFLEDGVDKGRHEGIRSLRASPYTRLGPHSDAPPDSRRSRFTRRVEPGPANFGEFRVPSLRNVSRTAPYMHAGSLPTLASVVDHYSELDVERLHVTTGALLRRLDLTPRSKRDLVAFLRTLDGEPPAPFDGRAVLDACR